MKEFSELAPSAAELPRWVDRLVDGELAQQEQRQLLVALEAEPEGWRRCALAFVEAQSWGHELRVMSDRTEQAAEDSRAASKRLARQSTLGIRRVPHWFVMAACVLLAFALGAGARDIWRGQGEREQIANGPAQPAANEQFVANAALNGNHANEQVNPMQWQALKVTIPSADGQEEQTLEVPLVEGNEQKLQSLLADQSPVLPAATRQMLETSGNEVLEHRTYYPVKLDDGRHAVLPMDYVEVRYTGGWQ
jgi:hypothetical protein